MQAALDSLKVELAVLDGRRSLLATAITSLEQLIGNVLPVPPAPCPTTPTRPDVTPRDPVGAARVDVLVRSERAASASIKGDEARVIELLSGRGEMSPKSIATTLQMAAESCRWVLKKLRGKGLIETIGSTNKAVVRLKLAKSPQVVAIPPSPSRTVTQTETEELVPVWSGATKRSPEDVLREQREARS